MSNFRITFVLFALFAAGGASRAASAPVSVKDLFRDYDHGSISMSPDGSSLVSVFPSEWEKRYVHGLASLNLETKESKILHLDHTITVSRAEWVGPRRQLVTVVGINYNRWQVLMGLLAFDADGGQPVHIVKPGEESALFGTRVDNPRDRLAQILSFRPPEVISFRGGGPNEILVAQQKRGDRYEKARPSVDGGAPPLPGVYRVNIVTGKYALHTADPGWTFNWFADPQGRVRVASGLNRAEFTSDGRWVDRKKLPAEKVFWLSDTGQAEEIDAIKLGRQEKFNPLGFEADGKHFLFSGRQGRDRAAIYAYDPASKTVTGPLVENERVDVNYAVLSPHDQTVAGIYVDDGLPRVEWLDPQLREMQPSIDQALRGYTNVVTGWTTDYQRILILSTSAQEPGRYFLLDRGKGSLAEVYQRAPWLQGAKFGETKPIALTARDGVPLHGYLTRPPGAADSTRLPLVLLVHGGPWLIRDYASFDPVVQFYATRGFAVLQVNFRRSAGYGRNFENLGDRQLGRTMQTDLDDAVDWAVAQGYADPARLLIAGGSYGGYATLMGLIQQPNRFRAGIAMFPLTDLLQQAEDLKKDIVQKPWTLAEFHLEDFKQRVGDPVADRDYLKAVSPNEQVAKIKAPLFIVYGPKDEIIDKEQVKRFIGRLKMQKAKFVHFAPRGEGHGISDADKRVEIYTALEKFLQQLALVPSAGAAQGTAVGKQK